MMLTHVVAMLTIVTFGAETDAPVDGSSITFPIKMEREIDGQKTSLWLTGTGLREKFFINVYAVGSYVADGSKPKNAAELVTLDAPKVLQLVFERDVDGAEMVDGLSTGIGYNYDVKTFASDLDALGAYMRAKPLKKGDQVWIMHVPSKGVRVRISGRDEEVSVPNPRFARAIWDIYLGPNNLGRSIKAGLCSRLPR